MNYIRGIIIQFTSNILLDGAYGQLYRLRCIDVTPFLTGTSLGFAQGNVSSEEFTWGIWHTKCYEEIAFITRSFVPKDVSSDQYRSPVTSRY